VYPVEVPYTVGGPALNPEDHNAADGSVFVTEGTVGSLSFTTAANAAVGEPDETVVFTMGAPVNAAPGTRTRHTVTISEANFPPMPHLAARQPGVGDSPTRIVTADGGTVNVSLAVEDLNPGDSHTHDWSMTSPALVDLDGGDPLGLMFDPSGLGAGLYIVRVTVTDDAPVPASGSDELLLEVVTSAPVLSDTMDSDGDGVDDAAEGFGDSDQDGIPDYLDADDSGRLLPLGDGQSIQGPYGMMLSIGGVAFASGETDAKVTAQDIADHGGPDYGPASTSDDPGYTLLDGYFDFEVWGLSNPGQVFPLVVPLPAGTQLPADAAHRKHRPDTGWGDFVEDARNALASAAKDTFGYCPPPGDGAYTAGLTEGDDCVQLTLEDGGPNDADDQANGVYRDPSAVVTGGGDSSGPSGPKGLLKRWLEKRRQARACAAECVEAQEQARPWNALVCRYLCRLGIWGNDPAAASGLPSAAEDPPGGGQPAADAQE
jgi:hypothetical protein